jgi:hypothetical protein
MEVVQALDRSQRLMMLPVAFVLAGLTTFGVSAQVPRFAHGGSGMSTSRVVSPTVVASWASHQNLADGSTTTLLVLWRGSPGWFSKGRGGSSGGGGGSGAGGGGSSAYVYFSEGGLTFTMEFDYDKSTVKILNQEISLRETNVVLVDFVDGTNGPAIVGYRWVNPAPPDDPSSVDPIAPVVKRSPELFEYLRCDLSLDDPVMKKMMPIICGQMRP